MSFDLILYNYSVNRKENIMKALHVILLSFPFILCPRCVWGIDILDIVGEYEGSSTFGIKIFMLPNSNSETEVPALENMMNIRKEKFGFFIGGKLSINKPEGELYDWSQSRAENFYKSDFRGYSDKVIYGFNGGVTYSIIPDRFYVYSGLGFIRSKRYREYYDDTFTVWSNKYYIEDGMKGETLLDVIVGGNLLIKEFIVGIGYSTADSNLVYSFGLRRLW